jgi:hemolysin activation/secretion protein
MPQHPLFRLPRSPFAAETRTLTLATTAALAMALSQGAAWAQQASNAEPASAHASRASATPRELGKPEEDLQLDVMAYQVDGLPGVPAAELAAITAPFVGKARGYEDLSNAVAAVTLYMQRRLGYYVGMAYLPEQQAKGGLVHIAVLEGRLDEVKVNWPEALPVQREVIGRYLARLQPGAVLRVDEVERVVFLVNDLPGIHTRFEIEPGRSPGTATLVVTPQAEPRVSSRAELDTLGSHNTGITRLGVQSSVASPSGLGDSLQLHVRSSTSAELYDGGLNYSVPVGAQGLKLGASINRVNYRLPDAIFTLDMRGSATATSVFGLYPWVRSRSLNVFGLASHEHKRFVDRLDAYTTSKHSNDLQVGTLGDWRDSLLGGAVNTFDASWLQGHMAFGPIYSLAGLRSSYGKLNVAMSRLQSIVPGRLQLYTRYRGQVATTNLDPTERMTVGGGDGVRAFGPAEGAADEAHMVSAELRWLPTEAWLGPLAKELALRTFFDWGHVRYAHDPSALNPLAQLVLGSDNRATLGAVGVGLTWDRPSDFTLRMDLAWRAQGRPFMEPRSQLPRADLALSKSF